MKLYQFWDYIFTFLWQKKILDLKMKFCYNIMRGERNDNSYRPSKSKLVSFLPRRL